MQASSAVNRISQEYEMVNPEGVVQIQPMAVNPHPRSLAGKTVVLRADEKHNADNALDRVAELLAAQVKDLTIIKAWEVFPETRDNSQGPERSKEFARKIASLKPDLVIGSQGD